MCLLEPPCRLFVCYVTDLLKRDELTMRHAAIMISKRQGTVGICVGVSTRASG